MLTNKNPRPDDEEANVIPGDNFGHSLFESIILELNGQKESEQHYLPRSVRIWMRFLTAPRLKRKQICSLLMVVRWLSRENY